MSAAKAPPEIFDMAARRLRRDRARKRPQSFLLARCLDDLAERLMDVNRNFTKALIVGDNVEVSELASLLPPGKIDQISHCTGFDDMPLGTDFDLVISLLQLQSENDLPGAILRLRQKLKPDGLFISSIFGGDTLSELRQVFYRVDEAAFGALSPHIFPMVTHSQAAALLTRAGLNQPVIDIDRFTVSYGELKKLTADLRDLGETNILSSRTDTVLTKSYWNTLQVAYQESYAREDGKLITSFEILWLTGWVPHKSQQKPLKPGSAKMRLVDALKRTD